jgi:hypothetical protein
LHDGKHIASASGDKTLKLWEESSSACLKTLDVGTTAHDISFDTASSYLLTDIETISLGISSASNLVPAAIALQEPQHQDYGLSANRAWIMWNGQNVLRLQLEYRPS